MTFPPQCTKRWQLYEQMARVLKMCEEAGFDRPWECVRYMGMSGPQRDFDDDPTQYEFALAIVEGKPVFRGDVLYFDGGDKFVVGGWRKESSSLLVHEESWRSYTPGRCTWNPPKPKTITINGVEVKAPESVYVHRANPFAITSASFDKYEDAEAFKAALEGKK